MQQAAFISQPYSETNVSKPMTNPFHNNNRNQQQQGDNPPMTDFHNNSNHSFNQGFDQLSHQSMSYQNLPQQNVYPSNTLSITGFPNHSSQPFSSHPFGAGYNPVMQSQNAPFVNNDPNHLMAGIARNS
jgi:hypothetical protein